MKGTGKYKRVIQEEGAVLCPGFFQFRGPTTWEPGTGLVYSIISCLLYMRGVDLHQEMPFAQPFTTRHAKSQAPVLQKIDSAIHRINLYPLDTAIGFPNTYPQYRDLSDG